MAEKQKKLTAKKVRELYLYPYRSKGENALRGGVWILSWFVGLVFPGAVDQRTLGGAYFIFALSLLSEFLFESKEWWLARLVHGFFCALLFVISFGALSLSFCPEQVQNVSSVVRFLMNAPSCVGWIILGMLSFAVVFALIEAHKFFYDEDAEAERENEAARKAVRDQFMDNLNGAPKGGNTQ